MGNQIKIATFNVEWMVNLFEPNKPDLLTKQNKKTAGLGASHRIRRASRTASRRSSRI